MCSQVAVRPAKAKILGPRGSPGAAAHWVRDRSELGLLLGSQPSGSWGTHGVWSLKVVEDKVLTCCLACRGNEKWQNGERNSMSKGREVGV